MAAVAGAEIYGITLMKVGVIPLVFALYVLFVCMVFCAYYTFGAMKPRRKKKIWIIVLLVLCFNPISLFVLYYCWGLWKQEKDPTAVLGALWAMKKNDSNIENVGSSGRRWFMTVGNRYKPLDNHLGKKGWQHFDQMGAIGIYKKNGQTMNVTFRMFTNKYMICQADSQP